MLLKHNPEQQSVFMVQALPSGKPHPDGSGWHVMPPASPPAPPQILLQHWLLPVHPLPTEVQGFGAQTPFEAQTPVQQSDPFEQIPPTSRQLGGTPPSPASPGVTLSPPTPVSPLPIVSIPTVLSVTPSALASPDGPGLLLLLPQPTAHA